MGGEGGGKVVDVEVVGWEDLGGIDNRRVEMSHVGSSARGA